MEMNRSSINEKIAKIGVENDFSLHSVAANCNLSTAFPDLTTSELAGRIAWFSYTFNNKAKKAGIDTQTPLCSKPKQLKHEELASIVLHAFNSPRLSRLSEDGKNLLSKIATAANATEDQIWSLAKATLNQLIDRESHKTERQILRSGLQLARAKFSPTQIAANSPEQSLVTCLQRAVEHFIATDNKSQAANAGKLILGFFTIRERGIIALSSFTSEASPGAIFKGLRAKSGETSSLMKSLQNLNMLDQNKVLTPVVRFAILAELCRDLEETPPEVTTLFQDIKAQLQALN